jgi:surfactin synthase thioesterase subunit
MPVRVARVLVIGAPASARLAFRVARPLLSRKLAARVHFCAATPPPLLLANDAAALRASTTDAAALVAELAAGA